jgi:hypothetical protein
MGWSGPGVGVFLSFLVEVNLLPFLGAVNGTDIVEISAFKLRRAHIPVTAFFRASSRRGILLAIMAELLCPGRSSQVPRQFFHS